MHAFTVGTISPKTVQVGGSGEYEKNLNAYILMCTINVYNLFTYKAQVYSMSAMVPFHGDHLTPIFEPLH